MLSKARLRFKCPRTVRTRKRSFCFAVCTFHSLLIHIAFFYVNKHAAVVVDFKSFHAGIIIKHTVPVFGSSCIWRWSCWIGFTAMFFDVLFAKYIRLYAEYFEISGILKVFDAAVAKKRRKTVYNPILRRERRFLFAKMQWLKRYLLLHLHNTQVACIKQHHLHPWKMYFSVLVLVAFLNIFYNLLYHTSYTFKKT